MVEKFLEFESKEKMFDKKIENVNFWGFIRWNIYLEILDKSGFAKYDNSPWKSEPLKKMELFLNCTIRNPLLRLQKREVLFIQTHRKEKGDDGVYECIFTGEVAKEFDEKCYVANLPFRGKEEKVLDEKNTIYLDYILCLGKICGKINGIINKRYASDCIFFAKELNEKIKSNLKVDLGEEYLIKYVKNNFFYYRSIKKMLRHLLMRVSPSVIVEVCSYGGVQLAINEIAKELDIKTIELQHGIINEKHIAYNYPNKKSYPFFPDELFLFSEYWKSTCRFPIEQNSLVVTGFPYIEKNIRKYEGGKKEGLNIIILSQPVDVNLFSSIILDCVERLNNLGVTYHMIYKLHPREYHVKSNTYDMIESYPQVTMIRDDKVNLYYYLASSDIQIGMYSTALYEGLAFGLATYLLNTDLTLIFMKDLYEKGYVEIFRNGKELVDLLLNEQVQKKVDRDIFFEKGAKDRIVSEIKDRVRERC